MKVLIVDNDTKYPTLLAKSFDGHDVSVVPWNGLHAIEPEQFDCAILSGSSNFPVVGHEDDLSSELELIRKSDLPILGICYGFELIVVAFGGTLKKMPERERGVLELEVVHRDPILDGVDSLFVYEGHRWGADALPDSLVPLAQSAHGIEAVKHADKCIYGLQFHPEKLMRETAGAQVLRNFMSLVGR